MELKEVDLSQPSELSTLVTSGFETTPSPNKKIQVYKYETPLLKPGKTRGAVRLATTDMLFAVMQVFEKGGGENVMHSHAGMDGFWLVISGRVRFYDENNAPIELGRLEGLCIPRDVKYWFEPVGDEPLELLQVDAIHPQIRNKVTFHDVPQEVVKSENAGIDFYDAQRGA